MSHVCEQLVEETRYLEAAGLSQAQLSALHHFSLKGRPITFNGVCSYFSKRNGDIWKITSDFASRVLFIAREHRNGAHSFDALVQQALAKWPLEESGSKIK
ncbi:MAG: hypothetical protein QOE96_3969 [Blastocatellia bacterium]|jgi:hypothetical protein|nr:hypothetical protein [Blastocatellia bacterium]